MHSHCKYSINHNFMTNPVLHNCGIKSEERLFCVPRINEEVKSKKKLFQMIMKSFGIDCNFSPLSIFHCLIMSLNKLT